MLPATPVSVPLTAGSLALLDTPEYGEDPCAMLLRRNLDSPHCMEDPNVPNRDDDDASSRRSSMDADEETDADETSQHPGEPAVHFDATNGSFVAYLAPMGPLGTHDNGQFADTFASHLANGQARRVGDRGAVAHDRGVQVCTNQNRVVLFRGVLRNKKSSRKSWAWRSHYPTLLESRVNLKSPAPSSWSVCTTNTAWGSWTTWRVSGRSRSWTRIAPGDTFSRRPIGTARSRF